MAIKYLHHTIEKMKNPENGKMMFELSQWHISDELPYVALRSHIGFYDTYEKAESENAKRILVDKFNK